jgi:plasmid stability protein
MSSIIRNVDDDTTHRLKVHAPLPERLIEEEAQAALRQAPPRERALTFCDATVQVTKWREEHAGFIAAYNATLEAEGLPLDEWRSF